MWRRGAEAAGESWHQGDSRYWISVREPHVVLKFVGIPLDSNRVRSADLRRVEPYVRRDSRFARCSLRRANRHDKRAFAR
jgi:hypothetical protein